MDLGLDGEGEQPCARTLRSGLEARDIAHDAAAASMRCSDAPASSTSTSPRVGDGAAMSAGSTTNPSGRVASTRSVNPRRGAPRRARRAGVLQRAQVVVDALAAQAELLGQRDADEVRADARAARARIGDSARRTCSGSCSSMAVSYEWEKRSVKSAARPSRAAHARTRRRARRPRRTDHAGDIRDTPPSRSSPAWQPVRATEVPCRPSRAPAVGRAVPARVDGAGGSRTRPP
jgi:hypothetical protein